MRLARLTCSCHLAHLTVEQPLYPTEVLVRAPEGGLTADSVVLLNQIRSVDTRRLVRRLGVLKSETMAEIDRALLLSLGLVEM